MNKKLTVKGHIIDRHAIECMTYYAELGLPFRNILEQFIERNHQEGKRLDQQSKRIVSAATMAETMAKRKALQYHELVMQQIKRVHEHTARGEYKKKIRRAENSHPPSYSPIRFPSLDSTAVTPPESDTTVPVDKGVRRIRELKDFKKGASKSEGTYISQIAEGGGAGSAPTPSAAGL